ncbi:MAG: hypothetical protein U0U67_09200 [Chitinophagales bacterium]
MNKIGYFEIQSENLENAIQFYTDLFGWKFIKEYNVPIEYYRIETGNINGGLLKRQNNIPFASATNAFCCSVMVDNFDATATAILMNGGQSAIAKFAIPKKCWQGYFLDLDNNLFGIFEVDENAS